MFETTALEVVARLREAYRPALVRIMKSGATYRIEDPERRGKRIAVSVQNERQDYESITRPDKVFAKRREEAAVALVAR
jgi:hypothetical protein